MALNPEQDALRRVVDQPSPEAPFANGTDVVDFWRREGVISSRHDIEDSQAHARRLRRRAERRL